MRRTVHDTPLRAATCRSPGMVVCYTPEGHRIALSIAAARQSVAGISQAIIEAEQAFPGATVTRIWVARRRVIAPFLQRLLRGAGHPARLPLSVALLPLALAFTLLPVLGLVAVGQDLVPVWLAAALGSLAGAVLAGLTARRLCAGLATGRRELRLVGTVGAAPGT